MTAELLADFLWWWWADLRLRPLKRSRIYRLILAAFSLYQIVGFTTFILSRMWGFQLRLWAIPLTGLYLWHLLVLPLWVAAMLLTLLVRVVTALARSFRKPRQEKADEPSSIPVTSLTRRQILAAAAVAAPPLLTAGAMNELRHFRIRNLTVRLPMLPYALDGLTIAHVTDIHVGRFTTGALLDSIVHATNKLKPDLILFTGDLIDYSLADLPPALAMMQHLQSRYGTYLCQGNHDLFQDRDTFNQQVRAAGFSLLVNEARSLDINGQHVQLLGLQWSFPFDRFSPVPVEHWLMNNMNQLLPHLDSRAFPILLSHYPHALDFAEQVNIPLTLAGHTHGGQLMLTSKIGVGPLMFKYISGLYQKPNGSALVVANGVGNWFPLRINAPAEIIHLTLRQA